MLPYIVVQHGVHGLDKGNDPSMLLVIACAGKPPELVDTNMEAVVPGTLKLAGCVIASVDLLDSVVPLIEIDGLSPCCLLKCNKYLAIIKIN